MDITQERYFPQLDSGYTLEGSYLLEDDPVLLVAELSIFPLSDDSDQGYEVEGPKSLDILQTTPEEDGCQRVEFSVDASKEQKIIVSPFDAGEENGIHIFIPSADDRKRVHEILEYSLSGDSKAGKLDDLDLSEVDWCSDIVSAASRSLPFNEYLIVLNYLCGENTRFKNIIMEGRYDYFTKRVISPTESFYVRDLDDLRRKSDSYGGFQYLYGVDWNDVLSSSLRELSHRNDAEIRRILDRLLDQGEQDVLRHLSPKVYYQLLALLSRAGQFAVAISTSNQWERSDEESIPYAESESGLIEAESLNEFKEVLADVLLEGGIQCYKETYDFVSALPMFEVAEIIFAENELENQRKLAKYYYKISRGQELAERGKNRSVEEFETAERIATKNLDQSQFKTEQIYESKIRKIGAITRNLEWTNPTFIAEIEQEIEDIENNWPEGDGAEKALAYLGGERVKGLADVSITNSSYQDAIERLNDAKDYFHKSNRQYKADWCAKDIKTIQAYLAEENGEFRDAVEYHSIARQISTNKLNRHKPAKFHTIRSAICKTKLEVMNGDYDKAFESLSNSAEKVGGEKREGALLERLLRFLLDLEHGVSTPIEELPERFEMTVGHAPFQMRFNYENVFNYINTLQDIQSSDVTINDDLLHQHLESAFTPVPKSEFEGSVQEDEKGEILLRDNWREDLPQRLNDEIEDVEMKEITTTGDHSDLAMKFVRVFESYLASTIEYYAKPEQGVGWKEAEFGKKNPTLGDLKGYTEDKTEFENLDELFSAEILGCSNIVDLRNDLIHEIEELEKEEYHALKTHMMELFERLVQVAPVPASPQYKNDIGLFVVELDRSGPNKQAWLNTDARIGGEVYLPPDSLGQGRILELEADELVRQDN